MVRQLGVGNAIVTRAGPNLLVNAVQTHTRKEGYTVYNLVVEDDHTYFVGNANGGAWVHNAACGYGGFSSKRIYQLIRDFRQFGSNKIEVASKAEADEVFQELFGRQGLIDTTGLNGNEARQLLPDGKEGTFHWDLADTKHGGVPHLQVQLNGQIIRIFFPK